MKHIVLCTIYDTAQSGGLSTFVKLCAEGYRRAGNRVTIIDERSVNTIQKFLLFWCVRNPLFLLKKDWGMRAYFSIMKRLVGNRVAKVRNATLLHAQDVLAANAIAECSTLKDAPLLLTIHGDLTNMCLSDSVVTPGGSGERRTLREEVAAYDMADMIVTVDTRLRNHVHTLAKREDITIIKNFVNTDVFKPSPKNSLRKKYNIPKDVFVVFCPRRHVKKNGTIFAAKAVKQLKNVLLVYAGSGPEEEHIKKYAKNLPVTFLGDVPHNNIVEWYQLCDAVVIPSVTSEGVIEATSIAALEGMACEKPVIASRIGGLAEVITDGKTGILVDEGEPKQIAGAIRKAMKKNTLGKNAREFVKKHHSVYSQTGIYLKTARSYKRKTRILFFNTFKGAHFSYHELMAEKFDDVHFINPNEYNTGHISTDLRKDRLRWLKNVISKIPIPTMMSVPKRKSARADLVYASQVIPLTKTLWILDLEMTVSLARFYQKTFANEHFQKVLRKRLHDKTCKAITTWTEIAAKGARKLAPKKKVHVVRPSVKEHPAMHKKKVATGNILYVAADFERKGGWEGDDFFGEAHQPESEE